MQLRVQRGSAARLIQYNRAEKAGPKLSDYTIATTQASLSVQLALAQYTCV